MIANARMYSVSREAAGLWRRLLACVIAHAGLDIELFEHAEPAPIHELWQRSDKAAVFMCGLPFALSSPRPQLIAAPVPAPPQFHGLPQYWSEMVVRKDSAYQIIEDTFGARIALTVPDSQSGCLAALYYLMTASDRWPPYREVIAPQLTPLGAMAAVVQGAAEIAPIDSYAFVLLCRFRPDLASQLRTIARTAPTPIPPLVASGPGLERLQSAFLDAHRHPDLAPVMAELLLARFEHPDPKEYDALRSNFEAVTRFWGDHVIATTIHSAFVGAPGFAK